MGITKALIMLRQQCPEYKEYKYLKNVCQTKRKKLLSGTLGETAAYTYYIQDDRRKELKKYLKSINLIN